MRLGFRLVWIVCAAVSALPVCFCIWFVQGFSLQVPMFDHWGLLPLYASVAEGHPDIRAFLAPHNGLHLPLVGRAFLTVLAAFTGWSLRAEVYVGLALSLYTVWILSRVFRETMTDPDGETKARAAALVLTSFLCFSPAADWTWTWSIGVYHYIENAAVATVCFALASRRPRLWLGVLACTIATFNRFEGIFTWFIFLPLLEAARRRQSGGKRPVALWGGAFGASAVAWALLLGLRAPAEARVENARHVVGTLKPVLAMASSLVGMAPGLAFEQPGAEARYGAPYLAAGMVVIAAFAVLSAVALARPETREAALPWVCIGVFGLAFALATSAARAGTPAPGTLIIVRLYLSAYSVTSGLVAVASVHLGATLCVHSPKTVGRRRLFAGLAAAMVAVLVTDTVHALPRLKERRNEGHWDRYCLELSAHLADANTCFLSSQGVAMMEHAGFAKVRRDIPFVTDTHPTERFTRAVLHESPWQFPQISVEGVAELPDDSAGTVLATLGKERKFVAAANEFRPFGGATRFTIALPPSWVHKGHLVVNLWVYDRRSGVFRPIAGSTDVGTAVKKR